MIVNASAQPHTNRPAGNVAVFHPKRSITKLFFALLILVTVTTGADDPPRDVTEPPAYDDFIVIPLRVHVLKAMDLTEIDCALTDADIERIVGKVNGVWHNAGIHFGVESIVREDAANQQLFKLAFSLNETVPLEQYRKLLPERSRKFDGLHLYFVHQFQVNGVYMYSDFVMVKETARLQPVPGGIDEPVPRVASHELGHALGLAHRQARTNLLASGTTGTLLNSEEVATARAKAQRYEGTAAVAALREQAEHAAKQNELTRAHRLWTWLSQIPGAGAENAKRELDQVQARLRQNSAEAPAMP
jgi:hypothetical protein